MNTTDKIHVGLKVLSKNNGSTVVGRENDTKAGTIHHNTLKLLVSEGLASDKSTAKGKRTIALTAAGKKLAAKL